MEPASTGKKPLTITPKTVITGKDGKKVKIGDLVGEKGLVVISEHGKVDSIGYKKDEKKKG